MNVFIRGYVVILMFTLGTYYSVLPQNHSENSTFCLPADTIQHPSQTFTRRNPAQKYRECARDHSGNQRTVHWQESDDFCSSAVLYDLL